MYTFINKSSSSKNQKKDQGKQDERDEIVLKKMYSEEINDNLKRVTSSEDVYVVHQTETIDSTKQLQSLNLTPRLELTVDSKVNLNSHYSSSQHHLYFSSDSLGYVYGINLSFKEEELLVDVKKDKLRGKKQSGKYHDDILHLKKFKKLIRNLSRKKRMTDINDYSVIIDANKMNNQYKDKYLNVKNRGMNGVSLKRHHFGEEVRMDDQFRRTRLKVILKIIKREYMISVFLYNFFISK